MGSCTFRGQKIDAKLFVQSFSRTLRVMDVRAENRGRPHQKLRFSAAPVMGRNFLTQGRPGVRVRNVRGKSGPKSLSLCFFFFPELFWKRDKGPHPHTFNFTKQTARYTKARFRPYEGPEWPYEGQFCGKLESGRGL